MTKRLTFEELLEEAAYHGYTLVEKPQKQKPLRVASKHVRLAMTRDKMSLEVFSTTNKQLNLKGSMRGITGDPSGIHGDCSMIYGNVSALRGTVTGLIGDVSGLEGDCTDVIGIATGVFGNVTDLKGNLKDFCRKPGQ